MQIGAYTNQGFSTILPRNVSLKFLSVVAVSMFTIVVHLEDSALQLSPSPN